MTSARESKRAAAAAAAAARAAGSGWSGAIGPLTAIDKLIQPVVDANPGVLDEPKAVVKQAAIATQLLHGINLQGASYDTWRNVPVLRSNTGLSRGWGEGVSGGFAALPSHVIACGHVCD